MMAFFCEPGSKRRKSNTMEADVTADIYRTDRKLCPYWWRSGCAKDIQASHEAVYLRPGTTMKYRIHGLISATRY